MRPCVMADSNPVIFARGLVKRYGDQVAVDGIDITVQAGSCVGIVGRNGAGKSTTVKMLTTVSRPTAGILRIFRLNPLTNSRKIKSCLGVVPQENTLDPELTVRRNLSIYCRYFGMSGKESHSAVDKALALVGLTQRARDDVAMLSGGMKRRVTIARALVNGPKLILMDEPTASLDAQSKHAIWESIREFQRSNRTVVITSHDMAEVENLCEYVWIMDAGKFVAAGSPEQLIRSTCRADRVEIGLINGNEIDWATEIGDSKATVTCTAAGVIIETDDGHRVMENLRWGRIKFVSASLRRTTLEDAFLRLTGRAVD